MSASVGCGGRLEDLHALVVGLRELQPRTDLHRGGEDERLARLQLLDVDLGVADRREVLVGDRLAEVGGHAQVDELLEHDVTPDLGVDERLRRLAGAESRDLDLACDRSVGQIQVLVDLLRRNLDRELDGMRFGGFNGRLHVGDQATRDPWSRPCKRAGRLPPMYEEELAFANALADEAAAIGMAHFADDGARDPAQGRPHAGDRGRHRHRAHGAQAGDRRVPRGPHHGRGGGRHLRRRRPRLDRRPDRRHRELRTRDPGLGDPDRVAGRRRAGGRRRERARARRALRGRARRRRHDERQADPGERDDAPGRRAVPVFAAGHAARRRPGLGDLGAARRPRTASAASATSGVTCWWRVARPRSASSRRSRSGTTRRSSRSWKRPAGG